MRYTVPTIAMLVLIGETLAACSSTWEQKWCWLGGCNDDAVVPSLPPPISPRAIGLMNATVAFCGFQPSDATAQALILTEPARTEESFASEICSATKPRWLINRGFVLPMIDGVPIRGRRVR